MRQISELNWSAIRAVCIDWVGTFTLDFSATTDFLKSLGERRIFVVTSGQDRYISSSLEMLKLEMQTPISIIQKADKPSGVPYLCIARQLGLDPDGLMAIDDDILAIRGALRIGVTASVWLDTETHTRVIDEVFKISSLRELVPPPRL